MERIKTNKGYHRVKAPSKGVTRRPNKYDPAFKLGADIKKPENSNQSLSSGTRRHGNSV